MQIDTEIAGSSRAGSSKVITMSELVSLDSSKINSDDEVLLVEEGCNVSSDLWIFKYIRLTFFITTFSLIFPCVLFLWIKNINIIETSTLSYSLASLGVLNALLIIFTNIFLCQVSDKKFKPSLNQIVIITGTSLMLGAILLVLLEVAYYKFGYLRFLLLLANLVIAIQTVSLIESIALIFIFQSLARKKIKYLPFFVLVRETFMKYSLTKKILSVSIFLLSISTICMPFAIQNIQVTNSFDLSN